MHGIDKKTLAATFLIILFFVTMSGCTDLFNSLKTYVPTSTPGPSTAPVEIGKIAPTSVVNGVTITGNGRTLTISGNGPYNMGSPQDYFTLNGGNTDISIKLKGQGFGCAIGMGCTSPYSGAAEFIQLQQFTTADRVYDLSKSIDVPYATQYYLSVNWGGDWEISITQ
jgi:hypothetical protein